MSDRVAHIDEFLLNASGGSPTLRALGPRRYNSALMSASPTIFLAGAPI